MRMTVQVLPVDHHEPIKKRCTPPRAAGDMLGGTYTLQPLDLISLIMQLNV